MKIQKWEQMYLVKYEMDKEILEFYKNREEVLAIKDSLNNDFALEIDGHILPRKAFVGAVPVKLDSIKSILVSQPREIREKCIKREKEMREKVNRGWKDEQELLFFISNL